MSISADEHRAAVRNQLNVGQRVTLARKIGLDVPTALSREEQQMLAEILQMVASDTEERVRLALAEALAANPAAPRDIVNKLIADTDLVAMPILRLSNLLTQDDLVALVESRISNEKMRAIAQRPRVPTRLCHVLAEIGGVKVAEELLSNDGADIPETTYALILDRYGREEGVQTGIVRRPSLPPRIISKAVSLISGVLLTQLVERHELPAAVSRQLVLAVRDQAILGFSTGLNAEGLSSLIDQLRSDGHLTPGLIFRSLIVGNIEFVIHVIALECQLGPDYVRSRLTGSDKTAAEGLWKAGSLPREYLELAFIVVDVLRRAEAEKAKWTPAFCRFQIIEQLFDKHLDMINKLSPSDRAFVDAARNDSLVDLSQLD